MHVMFWQLHFTHSKCINLQLLCRWRGLANYHRWQTQGRHTYGSNARPNTNAYVHMSRVPTSSALQVLDVVDGTGSGDVDTSAVVEAQDGVITGIHGDRLIVNSEWSNPTGKLLSDAETASQIDISRASRRNKVWHSCLTCICPNAMLLATVPATCCFDSVYRQLSTAIGAPLLSQLCPCHAHA